MEHNRANFPYMRQPLPKSGAERPVLHHPAWWLLFLPALLAALLFGIIPLGRTLYYSFTYFNMLETPTFIGLQNYARILTDELAGKAIGNTLFTLLLAGGAALLFGWLFGSTAARLPLPVGMVLAVLLGSASLCALFPSWAQILFSGDRYGLLNIWLKTEEPVPWLSLYANGIQCLLLFLLCLAPAYLIFYIGGRCGRRRTAWHVGVTAIPALMLMGWQASSQVVGFPSVDYQAHWLPGMIKDYGDMRFDIGFASALTVVCLLVTAVLIAVGHLLVWGVSYLYARVIRPRGMKLPRSLAYAGGTAGLAAGILAQFPLILLIAFAFKPTNEVFLFPPRLFPSESTTENFALLGEMIELFPPVIMWSKIPFYLPFYLVFSMLLFAFFVLPTAVGLAFVQGRGKTIAAAAWFVLTAGFPVLFMGALWLMPLRENLWINALWAYMTSPLMPLSVLLTVWILRRSADDCPTFTAWFSQTKRLVLTGAALLATGLGSALSLILAMQPTPYKARLQFPLQNLFSSVSGGMSRWNTSCALSLILYSVGILLVMALTSVLLMERRKLFRTEA